MRLLEFQAKRLLAEAGLPVLPSALIAGPEDLAKVSSWPRVLKAQVPVGGRGKAGAIRVANNAAEAAGIAKEILALQVKGHPVSALLAETPAKVERELYLALLLDKQANLPLLMASADGGVDIEDTARNHPERIFKHRLDPLIGWRDYHLLALAKALNFKDRKALNDLVGKLLAFYETYDATLVEINPLAVTPSGLVVLDAKVMLDDKAAFLHPELYQALEAEQKRLDRYPKSRTERLAEDMKLNYVRLDGDIGVIADGAGTGMLTVDLVLEAGGRPANFCEMGGLANKEIMHQALGVLLTDERLKVLLISLIGGMTRMDHLAEGIVQYLAENRKTIPLVVRMCGTGADVGVPLLKRAGLPVREDLSEAVRAAADLARKV